MNEKQLKSIMANIVRENTKRLEAINNADEAMRVCVYCCGTTYAYVCPECNEYDGLMPINLDTDKYLKSMDIDLVEILEG